MMLLTASYPPTNAHIVYIKFTAHPFSLTSMHTSISKPVIISHTLQSSYSNPLVSVNAIDLAA